MRINQINSKFNHPGLRNLVGVLLLSFFLFNIGGYFFYLKMVQYCLQENIRTQIRSELNVKDICVITISRDNQNLIQWKEKNKEFSFKGEMYDVVKSEIHGKTIDYFCINDIKETHLIACLFRHHKENALIHKILKRVENVKNFPPRYSPLEIASTNLILSTSWLSLYILEAPEICDPPPKIV